MGRKKIEIRPLTDERNRNVTFLKRKAGLMKKAWELSVLCGADVNILIFNAAGKAYEFSSKELDEEIDRYMDYEGMIERRRAPEFAAMALAGEDDEDEDEDEAPRRGSTSKSTANTTAGPNGAVPRSLKGKESFKARTPRHSDKGKSSSSRSSKHNKSKRRKERSESEKRSFIDSILSQSESDSQDDEDDEDEREIGGMRRKRKEKEKERSRDRRERQRTGGYVRDESHIQSDKNAAALQYAMSMHSAHPHGHGHGHGQGHSHGQHESRFYQQHRYHDEPGSNAQLPVDIPQLPKLPSDGTSYRTSMTSGLGNGSGTGGQSSSTFYGHSQPQYISQTHQYLPSSSLETTIPSQGQYSGNVSTSQGMANVSRPGGIQWNENLLAKYAEFQLQQNHQKQQRLLLERQRYQLQQMGVPVDERSLLDEIFGGNLSQAQAQAQGGSQAYGSTTAGGAGGGIILPIEDSNPTGTGGSADFVWPLGNNRSTTTNHPEDQFMPHDQSGNTSRGSIPIPDESVQWGVQDGYTVDRDDLNLPSPVSNGPGPGLGAEGKRKAMIFRDNEEVKRMRI